MIAMFHRPKPLVQEGVRPRIRPGIDWRFILTQGPVLTVFVLHCVWILPAIVQSESWFSDARLYFRATTAWLDGGNPWATSIHGLSFAGPPPTLLLNLPLIPFGEDVAWAFWPAAGILGIVSVLRRLRLPLWWILFPPIMEGWFAGSPDYALAGLALSGLAWIPALTKPYSTPAILAERGWRPVLIAGMLLVLTFAFLPWALFVESLPLVAATLTRYTHHLSAWGNPFGMVLVSGSLLILGRRLGLGLAVPALWPNAQLHYAVFSMYAASRSPVLAIGLSLPIQGAAPASIIVFAGWTVIARYRARSNPGGR